MFVRNQMPMRVFPVAGYREAAILANFIEIIPGIQREVCGILSQIDKNPSDYPALAGTDVKGDQWLRKKFLIDDLPGFILTVGEVMAKFTSKDLETIGFPKHESAAVQDYNRLMALLDRNGFHHARGRKVYFWSGNHARHSLKWMSQRRFHDGQFLGEKVMYLILSTASFLERKYEEPLCGSLMLEAFAASFASRATGKVYYISTNDKPRETGRSLTLHNFFWNAELPVLQRLRLRGVVSQIIVVYWHTRTSNWRSSDLNDPLQGGSLSLYRRCAYHHPFLADRQPERFIQGRPICPGAVDHFYDPATPKRPSIRFNVLRKVATKWRIYKKAHVKPLDNGAGK